MKLKQLFTEECSIHAAVRSRRASGARKTRLVWTSAIGFAIPCAVLSMPSGQAPSRQGERQTNDATYHLTEGMSPTREAAGATGMAKSAAPTKARMSSLVSLKKIAILPSSLDFVGPHNSQRLVVEGTFADGHEEELTSRAAVAVSDVSVAKVDAGGVVFPLRDGRATITATIRGLRAAAPLTIRDYSTATIWSFRNDVLPVMTKVGCNSGPCHGAAAGKNGFKLSLRGYDPITDYYTLTHQALARRTDRLEPARSLILLKPTLAISHGAESALMLALPNTRSWPGGLRKECPRPRNQTQKSRILRCCRAKHL